MKLFIRLIICITAPLFLLAQPKIVMLYGNGSAGKSSLAREVLKQDSNWAIVDEDDLYIHHWLQMVQNLCPTEYKVVSKVVSNENIFHATRNNLIVFNKGTSEIDCTLALESIHKIKDLFFGEQEIALREMLDDKLEYDVIILIKENLEHNRNVLFDRVCTTSDRLKQLIPNHEVLKALVFSPLEKSIEKFHKRNLKAKLTNNYYNARYYKHLISSFCSIYQITNSSKGALCTYTENEIEKFFDQTCLNSEQDISSSPKTEILNELTQQVINKCKKKLYPKDLLLHAAIYLSPKGNYDFIINTGIYSTSEAASDLLQKIQDYN